MRDWYKLEADEDHILDKHYTPGRGGAKIDRVVVHHNAGRLSLRGIYDVWQRREASAHYQVDADGRIGQYVWDQDTAWHAGSWTANVHSIGVEHANSEGTTGPLTEATLEAGAHLVAAICAFYQLGRPAWLVNVFPHQHYQPTQCPGHLAGSQRDTYMARAQAHYDQMITAPTPVAPQPAPVAPPVVDVEALARAVIRGEYGTGAERITRLGERYAAVQARVNQILGATAPAPATTIDQLAQEVINGAWGNGPDRVARLRAAGHDPAAVQARVNALLGSTPAGKGIDQLAREVLAGLWGNDPERSRRLTAAGFNAAAVQARVNQILG